MSFRKKLIEVALPLGAINARSAREERVGHDHPSTSNLQLEGGQLVPFDAVLLDGCELLA